MSDLTEKIGLYDVLDIVLVSDKVLDALTNDLNDADALKVA